MNALNTDCVEQVYILGGGCGDPTTVEIYTPQTGGKVQSAKVIGDYNMIAVVIGELV